MPGPPGSCRRAFRSTTTCRSGSLRSRRSHRSRNRPPTDCRTRSRSSMPTHTFILNGQRVSVDCEDDVRLLWVLRDLLGVRGPKYGCGLEVCRACTSHINGRAFNPCSVPVGDIGPDDQIVTIEGLASGGQLHPMQQAWIDHDVSQCGYCQPGQIMTAVAKVQELGGRESSDADLDEIRNVCRCGTYPRIREAIRDGATRMS